MNIDYLYNTVLLKSRNFKLYKNFKIDDNFQNKIISLLIHFSFILYRFKKINLKKKQKIFDNFFLKIETDLREFGLGDMSVNKKMKVIISKFYSVLVDFDKYSKKSNKKKIELMRKLFIPKKYEFLDYSGLIKYLNNYAKMIDLIKINDIYTGKF